MKSKNEAINILRVETESVRSRLTGHIRMGAWRLCGAGAVTGDA